MVSQFVAAVAISPRIINVTMHIRPNQPFSPRFFRRVLLACTVICSTILAAFEPDSAPPRAIPAARQASNVAVITISGMIDGVTTYSVKRRIERAHAAGANAIVFEIDSEGGELGAVLDLSSAIKLSPVPNTVAWIHSKAYSGGAIIAIACREIVVSPSAAMGDAFPVTIGRRQQGQGIGLRGLTPDERTKLLPPLLADVVDSARRSGFDEYLVQAIVIDGVELWYVESRETGQRFAINQAEFERVFMRDAPRDMPMIPRVTNARTPAATAPATEDSPGTPISRELQFQPAAPSLTDLRTAVSDRLSEESTRPVFDESQQGRWNYVGYVADGSAPIVMSTAQMQQLGFAASVIGSDSELLAFFGATSLVRLDESWSERSSRFLTSMVVRGILVAVFLLALFIEMTSPGMILPGAIAVAAGFLLIAPPVVIGMAGWWEIGAIVLGIALIAIEIFVLPGFGFFGVVGFVALFGGLIGTFIPNNAGMFPGSNSAAREAFTGMITIVLGALTAGIGMYFVSKHFGTIPFLNRLILTAQADNDEPVPLVAMMDLDTSGQVRVGDEGVAATNLKPVGQAEIGDHLVDVTADLGFIAAGTPIRVVGVDAWRVLVEATGEPPATTEPTHGDLPA